MKITIEQYGIEYSISNLSDDIDINEMSNYLRQLLLAVGFQPETVDKILEAQWKENINKKSPQNYLKSSKSIGKDFVY